MSLITYLVTNATDKQLFPPTRTKKQRMNLPNFDVMTKAQLMNYADKNGITLRKSWTKGKMLEVLRG